MKKYYKYIAILLLVSLYNCNNKHKMSTYNIDNLYPSDSLKIKYHNDWAVQHYPKRIKQFKENSLKHGDIVFIGNSLTESGGDWSKKLNIPNIKNRGISGDNTNGVLLRLNEITHYQPKIIFLLIGINDLDELVYKKQTPSAEYVANNIVKIAKNIHKETPKTKIYIQTILPAIDSLLIPHIKTVNSIIKSNENKAVFEVIDLHTAFMNENDAVNKHLFKDRLHLNNDGYAVWINITKPYLKAF